MAFRWLKARKAGLTKNEEKLRDKLKILEETEKRYKDVKGTKEKLQQKLVPEQELFEQKQKDVAEVQKELKQAKKEVKEPENDLATMEKATKRASAKVMVEDLQQVVKERYDELGKVNTEALAEIRWGTNFLHTVAPRQTTTPITESPPLSYNATPLTMLSTSADEGEFLESQGVNYQDMEITNTTIIVLAPYGLSPIAGAPPSIRRSSVSSVEPGEQEPAVMIMKEMEAVMKAPGCTPLVKWMKDVMTFVKHGKGDTVLDIILASAMQEKLKKAGRAEDAAQIADVFDVASRNWESIMDLLALSNSQEIANGKVINDFANNYSWEKKPLPEICRALCKMGIQLDDTVKSDPDGYRLFRYLRVKLPLAVRIFMPSREDSTWEEVVTKLQQFWNSETLDMQALVAAGGGGKHISDPVHLVAPATPGVPQTYTPQPVNVYNIYPNAPVPNGSSYAYPVVGEDRAGQAMARSMGEDRLPNTKTGVVERGVQMPVASDAPQRNPPRRAHGGSQPWQKTHAKTQSGKGRRTRSSKRRQKQKSIKATEGRMEFWKGVKS